MNNYAWVISFNIYPGKPKPTFFFTAVTGSSNAYQLFKIRSAIEGAILCTMRSRLDFPT